MLGGVSVDPGRTMLPVSPQISLRVEGPCPRGPWNVAVEHECQNSVSPRSPRNTPLMSILLKGSGFGWMWCTRDARESTARRKMRRSVFAFRVKDADERRRW